MVYVDLKVQSSSNRLLVVESYKFIYVENVAAACGCLTLLQGAQKKNHFNVDVIYIIILKYIFCSYK